MLLVIWGLTACTQQDAFTETGTAHVTTSSEDAAVATLSGLGKAEIQHQSIRVGSNTFDTYVAGPDGGELVVLLHGFPSSVSEWAHQFVSLSLAGYRVAAWHQRGYSPGARPANVAEYAESALAQDVLDITRVLGGDRFHLVGHDWGAAVAWRTAAIAPERVATLTAISMPHPDAYRAALGDPTSCQAAAGSYIGRFILPGYEYVLLANNAHELRGLYDPLPPWQIDAHLRVVGTAAALGAALNWYRAAVLHPSPAVGPVRTPATAIWGRADRYVCGDGWGRTPPLVTGEYEFRVLPDAGHWLPETHAADVTSAIVARLHTVHTR
ncbi:alpha/beta hydrolase [Pendulispora brunnea]|uniref:Alpha/beta hydrolase n=1 Tax=Pendulispora brunnea TaxID=2905690 RepID=A0ABZ2KKE8_9BACT